MSFRENESDGCPWCECMCAAPDTCTCNPDQPCPLCGVGCKGEAEE